jgi:hypothetical protein
MGWERARQESSIQQAQTESSIMTTMPHGENSGADFSTGIPSAASQDACSQQPRSIIATASASDLTCDSPSSICVPTASAIILPAPRESRASRDRGGGAEKIAVGESQARGSTARISAEFRKLFFSWSTLKTAAPRRRRWSTSGRSLAISTGSFARGFPARQPATERPASPSGRPELF